MKPAVAMWFLKFACAGIIAFTLLNIFCIFYYNLSIHSESVTKATDYKWEPLKWYSRMTENFAVGTTDINGYNNSYNPKTSDLGVLVMGSSHMEGFEVAQDENAVYLLNSFLEKDNISYYAYNIGISSHNLLHCARNLKDALEVFKPSEYVVIETMAIRFEKSEIQKVLDGSLPGIPSQSSGLLAYLQRFPYLRLCYAQFLGFTEQNAVEDKEADAKSENDADYKIMFDALIKQMSETAENKGVKLIIAYHPFLSLNSDGSAKVDEEDYYLELFNKTCKKYDVVFVDAGNRFLKYYTENYKLPNGFSNTHVGTGHMNKYGHRIFAEEIYNAMIKSKNTEVASK